MQHKLVQPEAGRVDEDPYRSMLVRESLFEPPLVDAAKKGLQVELLGQGELDGVKTWDLKLTWPDGAIETWYLDASTYREYAADRQVYDFTQSDQPMRLRSFFDDFRQVDGLWLPFFVQDEFSARVEMMQVEEAKVDVEVDPATLAPPPVPASS
jgi:hypothetical protein